MLGADNPVTEDQGKDQPPLDARRLRRQRPELMIEVEQLARQQVELAEQMGVEDQYQPGNDHIKPHQGQIDTEQGQVGTDPLQKPFVVGREDDDRHIEGEQEKFEIEPPHMACGLVRRDAQIRELFFLE